MALTYTTDFKGQTASVSATITSNTLTVSPGDFITIVACYSDNVQSQSWTVSNTGTAITWTKQVETNTAANCKVVMWSGTAGETPPTTISVESLTGTIILGSKALFTAIHTGTHPVTPLPLGNIFSGTAGTNVSQAITPTSNGSALWMLAGDWQQRNSFGAAANCSFAATVFDDFSQQTVVPLQPINNPRTDTAAFTIGETDTAGRISWVVWEVQSRVLAYKPRKLATRNLNQNGFRSNVRNLGIDGWRNQTYRAITPQATGGMGPLNVTHTTTGVLTGQGSTIVGSADHKAKHTTTGVLTGQASTIVGAAKRFITHVTSGVLTGQSSSVVGSAAHKAKHTTTGVLTGQASSISGTSVHNAKHTTTGALIGQSSAIAGVSVNGTAVTPVLGAGGGGGGRGIYYQDQKRRKIGKSKLDKLLDKAIVEHKQQLKGFAKSERPEVKKIVKPFIVDDAIVDYPSLQADIDAIRALMIEYQKFLVQHDEEEILILILLEVI